MIRKTSVLIAGIAIGAVGMAVVTQPGLTAGAANASISDTYRQLNLFGDIFERIRADYVEQPNDEELIKGAINGMLSSLDPHSSYMDPKEFEDMGVQTRGEFGGLGIEVTLDSEQEVVKVVAPMDDTPAARAGILAGDLITHIDGEPIRGLTLQQAVEKMRGPVNTPIKLRLEREGAEKPIEVELVRELIRVRSVRWRTEGDVGYIRITNFSEQTDDGLADAMASLTKDIPADKLKGFIIDLRNNPGGLFPQSVYVSDAFLDRGEIVSTRGRDPNQFEREDARPGDLAKGKPVVVLINGGSASASEIVAGALQDHHRATIVGTRSFGKGSVQTVIPLGGRNGGLRLTTARYFTPSGRSIQAIGITPDIMVEQELPDDLKASMGETRGESSLRGHLTNGEPEDEKAGSSAYVPQDKDKDKQLQYALRLLRGEETHAAFPPKVDEPKAN
ncbi:MAG: S41 family peptidase [Rhodobiaceae bacterium]|nr:S41 family peptidase [Rhodobiaceae bacterium]MCC0056715.1 S41 family peptidase [Rhodobiaceae bacterium]